MKNLILLCVMMIVLHSCIERHDLKPDCVTPPSQLDSAGVVPDSILSLWEKYDAIISGDIKSDLLDDKDRFVCRFLPVARKEKELYNIPISIKLAQGILESACGTGRLATEANNFFCVKCHRRSCHNGHCINHIDDSHKDFFIVYESAWASFRAHSLLLVNGKIGPNSDELRYAACFECGDDYKCWAKELSKAGYATDKRYANKLIRLIEQEMLFHYDQMYSIETISSL